MKQFVAAVVCFALAGNAVAGIDSDKAVYRGGTVQGLQEGKESKLDLKGPDALRFQAKGFTLAVPFDKIESIEYGQKAGRRVGAAIGTAVLLGPIGLALLASKKRKHMVTLAWTNEAGKTDAAVFELGKDAIRATLAILEAKSGKQVEYESPEAKANIGK